MGLFDRMRGKSMEDPVRGTATIVRVDGNMSAKGDALIKSLALVLHVTAEGMEPADVRWKGLVKAWKWAHPGKIVPVTVDRANPERIELHWDEAKNITEEISDRVQMTRDAIDAFAAEEHNPPALTPEQLKEAKAEIKQLVKQFNKGEIDADELARRQAELLGQ